jgi:ABC-type transporter Mla maintaining outer membrane lipid asymmetry ATPase subunit MlaF
VLDVRGLTGPAGAPILFDVDLSVDPGQTLLVLGPSQSGKTTLMRHILGLDRAQQGCVTVDSCCFDASEPSEETLSELRTHVGVIFASSSLLRRLSVVENVELPLLEHRRLHRDDARDAARGLLAEVGMRVDDETMRDDLTRAERRRVALARALALRPRLLLLDEPTLRLDSSAAHAFDDTLDELQAQHRFGVVIFSHEVRHAYGVADRIDILAGGRILARGTPDELLALEDPIVRGLLHRRERE